MKRIALMLGVAISLINFSCREPDEKRGLNPYVQEPEKMDDRTTKEYGMDNDSVDEIAPAPSRDIPVEDEEGTGS